MGTTYRITYEPATAAEIGKQIDSLLAHIDRSLSVYNPQSIISKINRNEPVEADSLFTQVFLRSQEIYAATNGAFDIAASPLFNAWGFGFQHKETISPEKIDSLKQFSGMEHVQLAGRQIIKDDPRVTLNANAIAKGFGTDLVASLLEQQGITNYIVEIGGEIRCKGKNSSGRLWSIGIDKPVDGNIFPGENLQAILHFTNKSLATSGNYRKFYEENGKKYAHTINPVTGYPVQHNLLSATVIADNCMTADAYATALMVIGFEASAELLRHHPELGAYLLYEEDGSMKVFCTDNIKAMIR